jgi:uncharacterized protein YdhG (YjbR/CyaY superfamily)
MVTKFSSVDAYLAELPAPTRSVLREVRGHLRRALPKAEEVISYQMPALKTADGVVVWFAGWKKHYSLYPASKLVRKTFAKQLAQYDVNDKGTIRFPLDEPVPAKLLTAIAKLRAKEVVAK